MEGRSCRYDAAVLRWVLPKTHAHKELKSSDEQTDKALNHKTTLLLLKNNAPKLVDFQKLSLKNQNKTLIY